MFIIEDWEMNKKTRPDSNCFESITFLATFLGFFYVMSGGTIKGLLFFIGFCLLMWLILPSEKGKSGGNTFEDDVGDDGGDE